MELPEGQKAFKMDLAIQTQYQRVTDTHNDSKDRTAERHMGKK